MIDLLKKVGKIRTTLGPINPIQLFESLSLPDDSVVKELWRPQADSLRMWHEKYRQESDILFKLNTGSGKTLIGLLAAQSIVNETQGKVLYVCSTNQLVEQTRDKAQEYGFNVATYFGGTWTQRDSFDQCKTTCITNYQALLNGKSIFERDELAGIIFDDAHTAHNTVSDQFTLTIERKKMMKAYDNITTLCSRYFADVGREQTYADILINKDTSTVIFVPTFITKELTSDFVEILIENGVTTNTETLFVWEYLKDKLNLCMMFITASSIQFTPPLPPIHTLRNFSKNVRRLYLSATMPRSDDLCRTFGRLPNAVIEPGGRAGDCERMILPAPSGLSDDAAVNWVKDATVKNKVLVMVTAHKRSEVWQGYGHILTSDDGDKVVRQFADSQTDKLILVARYDGIDLPGDACRILIVDGLPSGLDHMSKFFEQSLGILDITNSAVASRFVQILGRTSRGLSDFGTVILIGQQLLKWVSAPRNRRLLPIHLQKQLAIGDSLRDSYDEEMTLESLINLCLIRDQQWTILYRDSMVSDITIPDEEDEDKQNAEETSQLERSFLKQYWDMNYSNAAEIAGRIIAKVQNYDKDLVAWYKHMLGYCLSLSGQDADAEVCYRDAAAMRSQLGRVIKGKVTANELIPIEFVTQQAKIMADQAKYQNQKIIKSTNRIVTDLIDTSSHSVVEERIKELGTALGFIASRPDNDVKAGPDDLWVTPDETLAVIIESKHEKIGEYNKDDIGQFHNHIQWVTDRYPKSRQIRFIIGPRMRCSGSASPPNDLKVVALSEFKRIAEAVATIYHHAIYEQIDLYYEAKIDTELKSQSLDWEGLFNSIDAVEIITL